MKLERIAVFKLNLFTVNTFVPNPTVSVSLFNGISTFVGYLMPKPSL